MVASASTERTTLYRNLAQTAQEVRLLTDVLDAIVASTNLEDIVRMLESGIKNVLPSSNWNSIELVLVDDSGRKLRIYEVTGAAASRYWSNLRAGAQAAGRDLGVHVEYLAGDGVSQSELVREAQAGNTNGIAIAPIDGVAVEPQLCDANSAAIPVITFDTPPAPHSCALAYVGTNNFLAGQLAGTALRNLVAEGGLIGLTVNSVVVENSLDRVMGLEDAVGNTDLRMLPPSTDEFDPLLGVQRIRELLEQHPDMRGAVGVSGATGPQWVRVLDELGIETPFTVVSFDLTAETIMQLQSGRVHAAVAQREYSMGYRSIELLARIAADGQEAALATLPPDRVLDTGVDLVTLERTDWSITLAEYLQSSVKRRVDIALRERVAALDTPLTFHVIGMAEVGAQGIVERHEPLNSDSTEAQILRTGLTKIETGRGASHTSVHVPLLTNGRVLGFIRLASPLSNATNTGDIRLLERVASAVAIVVDNARLIRQINRRAREIEAAYQRQEAMLQTISELSNTVVPIARDVLVVPLNGTIDTQRSSRFVEVLLTAISQHQAQVVIIDISGVAVVDTGVANHLMQAARAAQLLGTEAVVVGITPAVAQTIVQLGVMLSGVRTFADLETGFAYALGRVGGRIVYQKAAGPKR